MTSYRTHDIAVRGGRLRVGAWASDDLGGPDPTDNNLDPAGGVWGYARAQTIVLAVHGITASHRSWAVVAGELTTGPGVLVLAPDLRGRGRSVELPGPWGMDQHAQDLLAVLDGLVPGRRCVLVGHSMGGFVAVTLAVRAPARCEEVLLVDGGVPLTLPPGWTLEAAARIGLGPAAERLSMTFAERSNYLDFWRQHPAFTGQFSAAVQDYVEYDLRPAPGGWRSSCRPEAMIADHAEQYLDGPVARDWSRLSVPTRLLRAPRGLQDEPGGLYSEAGLAAWQAEYPDFDWQNVIDVNHYTITLSASGASQVNAWIPLAERSIHR